MRAAENDTAHRVAAYSDAVVAVLCVGSALHLRPDVSPRRGSEIEDDVARRA